MVGRGAPKAACKANSKAACKADSKARGMSKTLIRSLCLLALLVSVGVRVQTSQARETMVSDFDVGAAVADVIRRHGYALHENPIKPPKVLSSVIYFQRPECDQPSLVLPYYINAETLPLLARLTSPGFDYHFYYLDNAWNEESRVAMFFAWLKHAVLDVFGASQYVPVRKALVLADAPGCRPVAQIDWRPVWQKDSKRRAAAGVNTGT
jgi:hypothetical protein